MKTPPAIMTLHCDDEAATLALGHALAGRLAAGDIIALSGPLGAGKTTLARAIIRAVTGRPDMAVPSPSFTLVQIYDDGPDGAPLWHVDLYRLSDSAELIELGLEDAWRDALTLMEWPEHAAGALPARRLEVHFTPDDETGRRIDLYGSGDWTQRLDGLAAAMARAAARMRLLRDCGWNTAACRPLAADASFRRYDRLKSDPGTVVLMDAPPVHEDVRPYMAVADLLRRWGFSAPGLLGADVTAGYLLLEDFGDDSFNRILARDPSREKSLYEAATDLLAALHGFEPPAHIDLPAYGIDHDLPAYDLDMQMKEAALFSEWFLPALHDADTAQGLAQESRALWRDLLAAMPWHPQVLTLRDYHADNLFWLAERSGHARVGLLDFQDAVRGHPAYDLVSLLQDARRPVPAALEDAMIARYLARRAEMDTAPDESAFRQAYFLLGAQRATKIIGIFMRLARRDGKTRYPAMIPDMWTCLERDLEAGALNGLRDWLEKVVPRAMRHRPPDFHD